MTAEGNSAKTNDKSARFNALMTMASSGDTWVKLATLVLVGISGLGNFLTTERTSSENRRQIEKDIHEVWEALDRNKDDFRRLSQDASYSRRILEDLDRRIPK